VEKNGLKGWRIVIAGGDGREVVLAAELVKAGADVWMFGFEKCTHLTSPLLHRGLPNYCDAIICPLAGVDKEGNIFAPYSGRKVGLDEMGALFKPGLILLCGSFPQILKLELENIGMHIVLTADNDEISIYNAIPTAEGAVALAMQESPGTIHGSKSMVIGFGRCGLPLARTLQGLGADVTVAARREEALAMAYALGFRGIQIHELERSVVGFDYIFNTVPAPVVTENVLKKLAKSAIVVDIASFPGGTDFTAAERLGIKSFLALGLPGKIAPAAAGEILSRVYPRLIRSYKEGGTK